MDIFNIITIYLAVGVVCGISIEALMASTNLNETTSDFERFLWIIFWPFFVLIFIIGMKK
jgi:flagellar biosynthesis protein FliQ